MQQFRKFKWALARRFRSERAFKLAGALGEVKPLEPPNALSRADALALVKAFPFWYHRIYLGNGVYTLDTPAYHEVVWERAKSVFPSNLGGASVLDVGANAGYFSIQLKQLGAGRVLGIESIEDYFKQAEICRRIYDLDIEYRHLDAHQIDQIQEQFDLLIFTGILYHLENPLLVLEQVGRICRDAVVIETEVILEDPRTCVYVRQGPYGRTPVVACRSGIMKFIEKDELNGDGSNWWVPDTECVMAMLRTAGFTHFSPRVYLSECRLLLIASKRKDSLLNLQALSR